MRKRIILLIDAIINFALGIILLIFPLNLIRLLGLPISEMSFYPSIFGAVLIGIAFALLIEYFKKQKQAVGLGISGAIVINFCGGIALALWLILGHLEIPLRGYVILWGLVLILFVLSSIELALNFNKSKPDESK